VLRARGSWVAVPSDATVPASASIVPAPVTVVPVPSTTNAVSATLATMDPR
jgi:hypothetical protein